MLPQAAPHAPATETSPYTDFAAGHYPRVPRAKVQRQYLPAPDQLLFEGQPKGLVLLTSEGSPFTAAVCEALLGAGYAVAAVQLPESIVRPTALPAGVQVYTLPEASDAAIGTLVKGLAQPATHFIHLHPHLRFPLGKLGLPFEKEKQLAKVAFFFAKHLKASLNAPTATRSSFLTVTRLDGALGTQNPGNVSAMGGGLNGLVKCMQLEWKSVFCRALDLAPELPATQAAALLLQELQDADQCLLEAAYDAKGKRQTLVAVPTEALPQQLRSSITPNSVFLVTGGARGVTADCVRHIAQTFRCKFILVGRSALSEQEPAWSVGIQEEAALKRKAMEVLTAQGQKPTPKAVQQLVSGVQAQREISDNLSFIRAQGAQVYYAAADVTDGDALRTAIAPIVAQTGPVTGILHGAGRLADKLIEHKTEADFDAVFDVKVQGLLAVTQAVDIHHIQHVVFFSSVAGFYGNLGQSDYAMANEVLNRTAHLFKKNHPDWHVVSVNWGAWDGGMVSDALKKMFEAHGVALVPAAEGPASLTDQLCTLLQSQAQVILGGTLPAAIAPTDGTLRTYTLLRRLTEKENPFLSDHVIQGKAVLPIVKASGWMAQSASDLYPGYSVYQVSDARLFKGVVFDGQQPELFYTQVSETQKDEEQITLQVQVSSRGGKLPLPHYAATITLRRQMPQPAAEALPQAVAAPAVADARSLYADGTLFHGTDFQGLEQIVTLDEHGALFRCEHPGVPRKRQGQFPVKEVNGFLTDIMYQTLVVWVRRFAGCASLPLSTAWTRTFAPLPFGRPFYVRLQVQKQDEFCMEADVVAFDAQTGQVYMQAHRASVTLSRALTWN